VPRGSSCVTVSFDPGWESHRRRISFIRIDMRWAGIAKKSRGTGSNWWAFDVDDDAYAVRDPGPDKYSTLGYRRDGGRQSFCRPNDRIGMAVIGGIASVTRYQNATVFFSSGYRVQVIANADTKRF
jgi:hypothetical protein